MNTQLTAAAHALALAAGAELAITPGVAYDPADRDLHVLAQALLQHIDGTGIDFISLRREGTTLLAQVDDTAAEEAVCPAAFARFVRRVSYDLLGHVWDGRLSPAAAPAAVPAAARVA